LTTFAKRYRKVRTRWNAEWWSIAFGGPIGNLLTALIADRRWITPDGLTVVSLLCTMAGAWCVLDGSGGRDIAAVVLLQVHVILDCMDGSLARYRRRVSSRGAFLDKVSDMIGLLVLFAAVGWRAHGDSGDAAVLLVAPLIAASFVLRGYVFWVVESLERARPEAPRTVGDLRHDYSAMTARERASRYLCSMWRIVEVGESDLYFWISLALVLGRLHEGTYALAVAATIWCVAILGRRYLTVRRLDGPR
jgi:phosphatidylglycerophosphate synthase